MTKWLYKRILTKLNLNGEQLTQLSQQLIPAKICAGPFVKEGKMCPNTTALSLKLSRGFTNAKEVRLLLKQSAIGGFELALFYLFFDIPAMISQRLFNKSLAKLRTAITELKGSNPLP